MSPILIMFLVRGQCGYVFGVDHVPKHGGEWF